MLKKRSGLLAIALAVSGLFAFRTQFAGSVKGTVNPIDAGVRAWVLSATDTFRSDITTGAYEILNVKPGTYRLIIEAAAPYKNKAKDSVIVTDGSVTDIGETKLEQ